MNTGVQEFCVVLYSKLPNVLLGSAVKLKVGGSLAVPNMSNWKYLMITLLVDAGVTGGTIYNQNGDVGFTSPLWNINDGNSGSWGITLTISTNKITCKAAKKFRTLNTSNTPVVDMTPSDDLYSYILSVIGISK